MSHKTPDILNSDNPRDIGDDIRIKAEITEIQADGTETDATEKPDITIWNPDGNKEIDSKQMSKESDGVFYYEWNTSTSEIDYSSSMEINQVSDFEFRVETTEGETDEHDTGFIRLRKGR